MPEMTSTLGLRPVSLVPLRVLGDDRLARLASQGDRQAFTAVYERYHQALYRYCRSILGSDEDARDALQNTMIRALRALDGERREIALKPWLYRIAHNEALRVIRARRPHAELEEEAFEAHTADPEDDRANRERLRELVSDLRELPDRQRAALVMRELNDLSYGEIAAALEVSEPAAKQAVYEARVSLQDFGKGREMRCDEVTRSISQRDGRVLRGRQMRAHLRHCEDCRQFKAALGTRSGDLKAIAPPLPAALALSLFEGIVGGGGGTGGGGLAGLLGGGAGKALGTGSAVKGLAAAAAVVTLGAGAAGFTREAVDRGARAPTGARVEESPTSLAAISAGRLLRRRPDRVPADVLGGRRRGSDGAAREAGAAPVDSRDFGFDARPDNAGEGPTGSPPVGARPGTPASPGPGGLERREQRGGREVPSAPGGSRRGDEYREQAPVPTGARGQVPPDMPGPSAPDTSRATPPAAAPQRDAPAMPVPGGTPVPPLDSPSAGSTGKAPR